MHCGEPTWLSIFQSVLLLFADSTMIPKFSYSSGQKTIEFRHSNRPWYTKFCSWVLEASSNHLWRGGLVYWESAKECMKYGNARGESWAAWWSRMQARCLKTWAWVLGTWISSKMPESAVLCELLNDTVCPSIASTGTQLLVPDGD